MERHSAAAGRALTSIKTASANAQAIEPTSVRTANDQVGRRALVMSWVIQRWTAGCLVKYRPGKTGLDPAGRQTYRAWVSESIGAAWCAMKSQRPINSLSSLRSGRDGALPLDYADDELSPAFGTLDQADTGRHRRSLQSHPYNECQATEGQASPGGQLGSAAISDSRQDKNDNRQQLNTGQRWQHANKQNPRHLMVEGAGRTARSPRFRLRRAECSRPRSLPSVPSSSA